MSELASAAVAGGLRLEEHEGGFVWHVFLATPKANVLDLAKIRALSAVFERARDAPHLRAVLLEGDGPHFSFGASVEEHLPPRCAEMLANFHAMLEGLLAAAVPCLAVVRGQCLGGALELASLCQRVFAAPGAMLGQPEIALGVFAPAASVALVERIGRGAAEDLLLSGRSLEAREAHALGLVDELADDPRAAALAYAKRHLLPRSASSLRQAVRAARAGFAERFERELRALELQYMDELMHTADALEGLHAFLDKRAPAWRDA